MNALLIIWGWLLLGAAIGRVVFVRTLGDQPRRKTRTMRDEYNRATEVHGWTDSFQRAFWAGLACFIAWPVALPLALMVAQTSTEKLRARRERLAAEVARLEQEAQR